MHIPDGLLPLEQALIYIIISGIIVLLGVWQSRKSLTLKQIPVVGVLAAGLFAAQMFNFPVPFGSSGHLIGTALATTLVGPWVAILIIASILIIQSFFGDGGLLALGANTLNMAIVGAFITFLLFLAIPKKWRNKQGSYAVFAGVAGFFSTLFMALFASVEFAIAQVGPVGITFGWMIGLHAIIGLAEGAITAALVFFTFKADASLFTAAEDSLFMRNVIEKELDKPPHYQFPVWGLVTSVGVFGVMSIFGVVASTNPDGLERTLEIINFEDFLETGFFGFPEGLGWEILQMAIIMAIVFSVILIISGITFAVRKRKYNKQQLTESDDDLTDEILEVTSDENITSLEAKEVG